MGWKMHLQPMIMTYKIDLVELELKLAICVIRKLGMSCPFLDRLGAALCRVLNSAVEHKLVGSRAEGEDLGDRVGTGCNGSPHALPQSQDL